MTDSSAEFQKTPPPQEAEPKHNPLVDGGLRLQDWGNRLTQWSGEKATPRDYGVAAGVVLPIIGLEVGMIAGQVMNTTELRNLSHAIEAQIAEISNQATVNSMLAGELLDLSDEEFASEAHGASIHFRQLAVQYMEASVVGHTEVARNIELKMEAQLASLDSVKLASIGIMASIVQSVVSYFGISEATTKQWDGERYGLKRSTHILPALGTVLEKSGQLLQRAGGDKYIETK